MARPKKEEGAEPPETLKECPACHEGQGEASKDKHGNWRCFCPACGYWDSMVYPTEDAAKIGWEACGGPEQIW